MILTEEYQIRLMAAMQEIMINGCLACKHDKRCTLPCHGKTNSRNPCPRFTALPYGEGVTLMYKRHIPEIDWDEAFKDIDWDVAFANMVPIALWLKMNIEGHHE